MSDVSTLRQIVYKSVAAAGFVSKESGPILFDATFHNSKRGVTGLLLFDGKRFLQALEGDAISVGATFARIKKDQRHRSVTLLADRTADLREFGDWDHGNESW